MIYKKVIAEKYVKEIDEVLLSLIPIGSEVALFDYPNHSNVGDSAIWLGEQEFLKNKCKANIVHVDDCYVINRKLPRLHKDVIILIHGGGNFGDLYPRHQKLREHLLIRYKIIKLYSSPRRYLSNLKITKIISGN